MTHNNQFLIAFLFLKLPPPPCAVLLVDAKSNRSSCQNLRVAKVCQLQSDQRFRKKNQAEEMCRQLEDEGDPAKLLEQAEVQHA